MKILKNGIGSLALTLLGLIITIIFFASCAKPKAEIPHTPVAGVMAFNLAPDQPSAGFTLSGNWFGSILTYGSYSTVYRPVYVGQREVGTIDHRSGSILAVNNQIFADSAYYSAFLMGTGGNYRNVIVRDAVEPLTPAAGKAWVRYVNAIPDSSTTHSITIGSTTETAAYAGVSGFIQVDAGTVSTAVTNGSSINASRTLNLEENRIYTVLFMGLPNPTDPETAVQIRFIQNGISTSNN